MLFVLLDPFDDHLHTQVVADVANGAHQSPITVRFQQAVSEVVINLDKVDRVVEQGIQRTEAGSEIINGDADSLGSEFMQQSQRLVVASGQLPLLELEDEQLGGNIGFMDDLQQLLDLLP